MLPDYRYKYSYPMQYRHQLKFVRRSSFAIKKTLCTQNSHSFTRNGENCIGKRHHYLHHSLLHVCEIIRESRKYAIGTKRFPLNFRLKNLINTFRNCDCFVVGCLENCSSTITTLYFLDCSCCVYIGCCYRCYATTWLW